MAIFAVGVVLWVGALIGSHEYEVQQLQADIVELEAEVRELEGRPCVSIACDVSGID